MTDEDDIYKAQIQKLGAQMRMAIYEYTNAVWAVVEEELVDYPEAPERVRLRLEAIRSRRAT